MTEAGFRATELVGNAPPPWETSISDPTSSRSSPRGITLGWLARRVALGVATLWMVATLVFVATYALPSDPAQAILGRATPAQVAALDHELGLDKPLGQRYVAWLAHAVRGDLGTSLAQRVPVGSVLGSPLVDTATLLAIAGLLSVVLGLLLGVFAAYCRGKALDRILLSFSLLFTAIPDFVVGITLVLLLSTSVLHVLPAVSTIQGGQSPLSEPGELILPVAALVLVCVPYIFRMVRASMVEALASDYVAMARLKGVPERRVVLLHALPNALVAPVQASAIILTYLLSGVVVVEYIFGYPGLGTTLTQAVSVRDVPVIQGVVLIFATGVVCFNLIADVLTILVTPRLRAPSA